MVEEPISVVLADDIFDIRFLTRMVLERAGRFCVVGEAENGERAIDQVVALKPDVVLLDLAMPVMDGLAAIPYIRAGAPETKIIVLSGFEKNAMADEALRLGAVRCIQKGAHKDDLVREILDVCGIHEIDGIDADGAPADDV